MSGLFSYEGKTVVLTGGTTGVGAAAVELLAENGCTAAHRLCTGHAPAGFRRSPVQKNP